MYDLTDDDICGGGGGGGVGSGSIGGANDGVGGFGASSGWCGVGEGSEKVSELKPSADELLSDNNAWLTGGFISESDKKISRLDIKFDM